MTQPLSAPSPNLHYDPFAGADAGHDDGAFGGRNVAEIVAELGSIVQSWNESTDLLLPDTDLADDVLGQQLEGNPTQPSASVPRHGMGPRAAQV